MGASGENTLLQISQNWSRRGLIFGSLAVSASAFAKPRRHRTTRVLFVCQFGTAKSAIAREVFRKRAHERGVAVDAFSRGLTIEDHILPPLRQKLLADGIDPSTDAPKILLPRDWRYADVLVAFNPLPTEASPASLQDWTDMPSFNEDYANARATLDKRIDALLDEITKSGTLTTEPAVARK
jgi:protein-tyrosine-phosphatase